MLKQTIHLFIKALVIGVLINTSLQQVAGAPLQPDEKQALHHEQQSLKKVPVSSDLYFSDQTGD
jgi:hypothetical protein